MMARRVAAAWAALILAASAAAPASATETSYAALFDQVWKAVDENFYDPGFHGADWRTIGDRYRARVGAVHDDAGFSRLANAMLDELHVSHLYLSRPPRDAVQGGVGIAARTELIDGRRVVVEVAPLSDAQRQGLRVGDRLASAAAPLSAPLGAATTLAVTGCDGRRRSLTVRHEGAFWPPQHPAFEWRQIAVGPKLTLGYLRIGRFDDGAAALADQAMAELKVADGLVIDVRGNSGGNLSGLRLVSYVAGDSRPVVALLARPYLKALGRPVAKPDLDKLPPTHGAYTDAAVFAAVQAGQGAALYATEDLGPSRYRGKVVVVTDRETASAGEGFAKMMRQFGGATLVGRPTAGLLLSSDRFPLPDGWVLTVPVQGVWGADGRDYGDQATAPDVVVPRTAADLCRADDPDLAKAEEVLRGKLGR
ncbi:MAG: hypothetical protein E7812_17545 [Phenylobacterium sp.]|nr:MAG: hypothetical protein E7812_17545 [Phenylobacterium sp.]